MAERLEVTSVDDVAMKRAVRSRELDQWLDGGVWKLRPGADYDIDTDVMQRRLYGAGVRRKVSVAVRIGSDLDGVFVVVQAPQQRQAPGRRSVVNGGR